MLKGVLVCVALLIGPVSGWAESVFTVRPDDPAAITVEPPDATATDHNELLQAAIDRAGQSPLGGIVFVPSGRYRITQTLIVWRGVRVIGYGVTRPVLVLPDATPGYQTGIGLMVHFTSAGPGRNRQPGTPGTRAPFSPPGLVPPNETIPDANQGTFYSSMLNVDIEIGTGNPAAIAVRFHVAQHGILAHMDFHIGSGLAALTEIGNVGQNLRFFGGRYGILTSNTSPFWPYTLIDSVFDGQREAAIREHMAGLTLVRTTIRNTPIGVSIDRDYSDQLWLKDVRFDYISTAALVIDKEQNPTTSIGVVDAACSDVPVFARYRQSGKTRTAPSNRYLVARFHHGVFMRGTETTGSVDSEFDARPLRSMPPDLPPAVHRLPPSDQWVNVRTLGVKGDGQADDTQAIQAAIAAHRVLYFPTGFYIVRNTITLRPDTVLIGLHPQTTQIDLPDRTSGFAEAGSPKAVIEAPQGGSNIVSGLGVFTGATNPAATAILWMAGENSLLDDIQIHGAAGSFYPQAVSATLFGTDRPATTGGRGRSGAQFASIWVTRGGGGTFHNIWSPNTYSRSGFHVSDTTTPGYVYELSAEHHLFTEIKLDRVENWEFHGPQTEEESSAGAEAVAFEITDSKNITIANYRAYRVARSYAPYPAAVRIYTSTDISFRNVYVNAEHGYAACDANGCGTFLRAGRFAYDNSVEDVTQGREVRERNFAKLDVRRSPTSATAATATVTPTATTTATAATGRIAASAPRPSLATRVPVLAPGAMVEKLAGGFYSIAGAAVDATGVLYFVDRHEQRIYSWSSATRLRVVRDAPLDAVNLAFDRSGNLLVLSSAGPAGSVFLFRPDGPRDEVTTLRPQTQSAGTGSLVAVPTTFWADGQFRNHLDVNSYEHETHAEMFAHEVSTVAPKYYVTPDGSLQLPAGRVFTQGPDGSYPGMDETGWRWSHALGAFGLTTAKVGEHVYVTSGAENRTYRAVVRGDGTLGELDRFAERGGEAAVADPEGNVYIANGQVFVYDRRGAPLRRIDVPERPTGLRFGGADGRTLFILTHHSLYAVQTHRGGD